AVIRLVQFPNTGRETMPMTLRKQIEALGSEATDPGEQSPGAVNLRSANDGRYGKVAAALAPAPVQKTVLGQPGIELLTRNLQKFGCMGFVVASDLQS